MNFVFCVIMFYIQVYSASENYEVSDHKYNGSPKNMGFNNKNTVVPTANLKLNVFDKMLSEEMLSIKQHFQDRDSIRVPSVRISVQATGATPTLEVKQKWPIEHLFLNSWSNDNESKLLINDQINQTLQNFTTNGTFTNINKENCSKNECNSEKRNKVLGLRSLPERRAMRVCDCMKTNPQPTCSHICTGLDASKITNTCKHTNKEIRHECTRTASRVSSYLTYSIYPIYVTHPPYFWGISTYTENPYYHPNPINEIKISKTKRRRKIKKPRPNVDESYQEVILDSNERYDNGMENYINSLENYEEDINYFSGHKLSTAYNIATGEYEDDKFNKKQSNKFDFINKGSFIKDIVEDLKEHYSDVVIKDCYCSLSSRVYILNIFLFQCSLFVYLFIHF